MPFFLSWQELLQAFSPWWNFKRERTGGIIQLISILLLPKIVLCINIAQERMKVAILLPKQMLNWTALKFAILILMTKLLGPMIKIIDYFSRCLMRLLSMDTSLAITWSWEAVLLSHKSCKKWALRLRRTTMGNKTETFCFNCSPICYSMLNNASNWLWLDTVFLSFKNG